MIGSVIVLNKSLIIKYLSYIRDNTEVTVKKIHHYILEHREHEHEKTKIEIKY